MAVVLSRAISRSVAIARLDVETFEEVEHDQSATQEAGFVAVAASVIGSVGSLFVNGLWGFISWIIILVVGWIIWAWLSALESGSSCRYIIRNIQQKLSYRFCRRRKPTR